MQIDTHLVGARPALASCCGAGGCIAAALLATLRQLRDGQQSLASTCVSARTNKAVQRLEGWLNTKFQSIPNPFISRRRAASSCLELAQPGDQIGDGIVLGGLVLVAHQLAADHVGAEVGQLQP